jgi:hypothetical protein
VDHAFVEIGRPQIASALTYNPSIAIERPHHEDLGSHGDAIEVRG